MRPKSLCACVVPLAIAGILAGCTGQLGRDPSGVAGSGAGNTAGSGSAGSGAGAGTTGSGSTSGGAGSGSTSGGAGTGVVIPTGSGGTSGSGTPGALNLNGSPKYYRVVRLTNAQWAKAVQQVLNLSAPSGLEQNFQTPITGMTDFGNNELVLTLDARYWQDYQTAAETLAAQVTATDAALARVYSGTDAAGFITTFGRRVYRRPLTAAEQATYMTLYNSGASLMGTRTAFAKGASLVIRAMLQSPFFLYRTELGAKGAPLNAYEMASKLSLFLRGAPPDDATLTAAGGTGRFDTADGAATLATTLLADAAAAGVMRQFHGEWLHFDEFDLLSKVGVSSYRESLNAEYLEASFRFFDKLFTQGLGVKEMFLSTSGFYSSGMASFYGLAAPASGTYVEADLGARRVGYFAQLPYLTLHGMNAEPNSILRGATLNIDVLCATLGPPAANIPPVPPLMPGQTNRQRIDTLTGGCGMSCHNDMINPLGFAFERFDGMGQWRDTENGGLALDSSGRYTFSDGTTRTWTDAAGLMEALASTPQAHTCYSKKLASYALQRDVVASDMPMLNTLTSASMASGGSVKQLIIQLVKHDAFRTHGGSP